MLRANFALPRQRHGSSSRASELPNTMRPRRGSKSAVAQVPGYGNRAAVLRDAQAVPRPFFTPASRVQDSREPKAIHRMAQVLVKVRSRLSGGSLLRQRPAIRPAPWLHDNQPLLTQSVSDTETVRLGCGADAVGADFPCWTGVRSWLSPAAQDMDASRTPRYPVWRARGPSAFGPVRAFPRGPGAFALVCPRSSGRRPHCALGVRWQHVS